LQTTVAALGAVAVDADVVVASASYDTLLAGIVDVITAFHGEQPYRKGLDVGSLATRLEADANSAVLRHALHRLVEDGTISDMHGHLALKGFDPFAGLSAGARQLVGRMEQAFLEFGLEVPAPQTVVGTERSSQTVYRLLLDTGRLVRLRTYDRNTEIVVHAATLDEARRAIEGNFPYPHAFALKDIRDLLGSTRKYVVPLMEHFDATGMTVRTGDLRRLRQ
jgi:selenocysteine-specific elongation factor